MNIVFFQTLIIFNLILIIIFRKIAMFLNILLYIDAVLLQYYFSQFIIIIIMLDISENYFI